MPKAKQPSDKPAASKPAVPKKEIVGRVRVCRRRDGATFVYTDKLAARNDMRIGTKIIYSDGSSGFQPESLAPSAPEVDEVVVSAPAKLPGVDTKVVDLTPDGEDDL